MSENQASDFDAIVVGASLAGCTTATLMARNGASVALIEQRSDPRAFKRMCTHYIQASAVPTLHRLGLLEKISAAGGVRSSARFWTRWGWIEPPAHGAPGPGVNIRRERLDPMVREMAGDAGAELIMGQTVVGLTRSDDAVCGVQTREPDGRTHQLRAPLVIGADGRESNVARLAAVKRKELPHNRFAYGAYFEGPGPEGAPDATIWFLDPQWAAAFPTDAGLTFYGVMLTKERLPEFRGDRERALRAFMSDLPDAPPILASRQVSPVLGKLEMPNVIHQPVAPGLALVGDAALATDPLFGVGCGWAFQSGEWLTDSVMPALRGEEPLPAGLRRYARRHRRQLAVHAFFIHDYATGRPLGLAERMMFSAAVHDPGVAGGFLRFGTRSAGAGTLAATLGRALIANAKDRLRKRDRAHLEPAVGG
jgi:2-polyprenyl-6-methoxyphenol hydroxylase-like FAD-dependent oxidoreductase